MQLFSLNADKRFLQDGALNPSLEIISLALKESEEELVDSNKLSIGSLDGSFIDIDFQSQKKEYMVPNWNTLIGTLRQAKKSRDKYNFKFNISSKIYDSWRQFRPFKKEKALLNGER